MAFSDARPFRSMLPLLVVASFAAIVKAAVPEVQEDVSLPMVHVPVSIFWVAMVTGFCVGLGFGVVFTLCWRRQMSIDKYGANFGELTVAGSRSSFQKAEEYRRRELCPLCPWMSSLKV